MGNINFKIFPESLTNPNTVWDIIFPTTPCNMNTICIVQTVLFYTYSMSQCGSEIFTKHCFLITLRWIHLLKVNVSSTLSSIPSMQHSCMQAYCILCFIYSPMYTMSIAFEIGISCKNKSLLNKCSIKDLLFFQEGNNPYIWIFGIIFEVSHKVISIIKNRKKLQSKGSLKQFNNRKCKAAIIWRWFKLYTWTIIM